MHIVSRLRDTAQLGMREEERREERRREERRRAAATVLIDLECSNSMVVAQHAVLGSRMYST